MANGKGFGRKQFEVLYQNVYGGTLEKSQENSLVMVAAVTAEIRTEDLLYVSLECYCCTSLLSSLV
jgi:hypothetical protein